MKKILILLISLVVIQKITTAQTSCHANFNCFISNTTVSISDNSFTSSGLFSAFSYMDYGNGIKSQHYYPGFNMPLTYTAGTYTICLYLKDSISSCRDTFCKTITIGASTNCQTSFSYTSFDSLFYFTPTSWGGFAPYTYNWEIDDSTTMTNLYYGNAINPTVVLPANHTLGVTLTSFDSLGCATNSRQLIFGNNSSNNSACHAVFTLFPDTINQHNYFGYNYSTGSNLHYYWSWGDGLFDTTAYPTHTYAVAGFYTVCLSIHNSTNTCSDSACVGYFVNRVNAKNAMHSITVLKKSATGINDFVEKTPLNIYPNPTNDELNITLQNEKISSIKITSINGQIALQSSSMLNKINVSNLDAGIYFIEIKTNDNVYQTKFIRE